MKTSSKQMLGKWTASAFVLAAIACPAPADVLLIGNKGENTVSFVDLATGAECARVPTGIAPHEIAISPDGRQAAVVAYGGTTIDIFDIRRQRMVKRIDIAPNAGPHGIGWIGRDRVVVTSDRSNTLAVVDPRTGRFTSIASGQRGSHLLAVSPDRSTVFVSNILSGTVSVFDLQRGVKTGDIAVGGNPEGLAITPDGRQLWVGDNSGPRVRIVDLATGSIVATLPSDPVAIRIAISPDGKTAVSSNFMAGTLTAFDVATRKPERTIEVSGSKQAMQVTLAFAGRSDRILVAETGRDTVAEVDLATGSVLRRIAAGRNGDGLAIAPGHCRSKEPLDARD